MTHSDPPLKEQAQAEMHKRWSFLGMDFKKFASSWRSNGTADHSNDSPQHEKQPDSPKPSNKSDRRSFGKVIPSFGRVKTFKRQQSELRDRLEPIPPSQDERRAVSADRRTDTSRRRRASEPKHQRPRASAPAFHSDSYAEESSPLPPPFPVSLPASPVAEKLQFDNLSNYLSPDLLLPSLTVTDETGDPVAKRENVPRTEQDSTQDEPTEPEPILEDEPKEATELARRPGGLLEEQPQSDHPAPDVISPHVDGEVADLEPQDPLDGHSVFLSEEIPHPDYDDQHVDNIGSNYAPSMTDSQYDSLIQGELERKWILNLSMHFRDKSKREKFFVTYQQKTPTISAWRRVTVSLDYRDAPENSLEFDMLNTKYQRDKSAKIYEAIRESLPDIQFYSTVTNLKLQTMDGRLHVHVVEDVNEIINYPSQRMVDHVGCPRVRESDIELDSHMSGFVYKVKVKGQVLIKKEIPGPDTVDEFLYEVNALNRLRGSNNVVEFYGVVVDDDDEKVKGLLISYAEKGALIDMIYDHDHSLEWELRLKWARQIVQGLSDIHESGFVQGDFTLSNIVIDENYDAKIIDINRRGCPVGWEPPEAAPLIESGQRISMYIGVKSDLFQLGMVLWALATQEDEPESHPRPLHLSVDDVPQWYCRVTEICLNDDPRRRLQAASLLPLFPGPKDETLGQHRSRPASCSVSEEDYSVTSFPNNQTSHHVEQVDAADVAADAIVAPRIKTVSPLRDWSPVSHLGYSELNHSLSGLHHDNGYKPTRGRSPPRDLGLVSHGVTPRYSWHDNNIATGWESKSTTPCTGLSPHRDPVKLGEVQPPGWMGVVDTIPVVEAGSVASGVANTSGNTDAGQRSHAGHPNGARAPEPVKLSAKEEAQIAVSEATQHVHNTQRTQPDETVLPKGANDEEEAAVEAAAGAKVARDGLCETASIQYSKEIVEVQVEYSTTRNGDKKTCLENRDAPDEQDEGIIIPHIKVETADSQGKDSGIDTSKVMSETELQVATLANARKPSKDYESSNARAITSEIPPPSPAASPSPVTQSTPRPSLAVSTDPILLIGICGNTESVMNEKGHNELSDELNAMVGLEVVYNLEPTGYQAERGG